jgi:MSHA biogenesis protein MshL
MRTFTAILAVMLIAGCQGWQPLNKGTLQSIDAELATAAQRDEAARQPEAVSSALLPPLKVELPKDAGKPLEPRFDLVVNNAPASEVFMSIVSGTRYSMLIHPEVTGNLSVNLKDVSVTEALDAIHELYGYDYKVDATRIYVFPLTLQTRVFQVSYLTSQRKGRSELRVTASTAISGSTGNVVNPNDPNAAQGGQSLVESADVRTMLTTDFWDELAKSVAAIVGTGAGRSVVVSPQSGVIVVRAMPEELRNVVKYLKASQIAVERQVILEAKILEVQLDTGYQQGINWAAFNRTKQSGLSSGQISPGTVLAKQPNQPIFTGSSISGDVGTGLINGLPNLISNPGTNLIATAVGGGIFGLAFQNASFAALLSFLETQGTIHVLSSPRIATLNNQKAVLKVGQDELFVTNVSGGSNTSTGTITTQPTITIPTVTFQSFFSGVALDVTPRIDETDNIILHIHPSVSDVQQVNKVVDTGIAGKFNIPVPRSSVQETDAIVRAQDGQVVVLGGLMRQSQTEDMSQVPTAGDLPVVGPLFRQNSRTGQKRELVILLKPTVVKSESVWSQNIIESKDRITGFTEQGSTVSK